MGCTAETKRCVYWNEQGYERPECCTEILKDCLFLARELLNSLGVKWWVSYGTLLGAYRHEGTFIPWDTDCDVSFLYDDIPRIMELRDKVQSRGFVMSFHDKDSKGYPGLIKISRSDKNTQHCDLWPWKVQRGFWPWQWGRKWMFRPHPSPPLKKEKGARTRYFPASFIQQMEAIQLYSVEFPCPSPVRDFLVWGYGKDFMTPSRWRR
ncbi:MAG: LicD family protein [Candidatus Omnitrophica bacterium]|nr:LicD family protein [Candidatus Omnitrophota bacterium]